MRQVLEVIEAKKSELARHPLLGWLRDDRIAPRDRLAFAPAFVTFILGFRDMNRWFLRYAEPRDRYERAISEHAREDATHAQLFLDDFQKLGFDTRLGWAASDTIAWYYAGAETELFREFGMEILGHCVRDEDPFLRFALMEAMEACGHVFFAASAEAAAAFERESGIECRYFGAFHLARETGHLIGAGRLFESVELDTTRRARARALSERIFEMFWLECDRLLAYAERTRRGEAQLRADRGTRDSALASRESAPGFHGSAPPSARAAEPANDVREAKRHPSQHALAQRLAARKQAAEQHPLFAWMRRGDGVCPRHKLQRVLALWIPDVMGYRDLNAYALSYRHPADHRERAIRRLTANLEAHHALFLRDWAALDMDRILAWSASDTLAFCGLSSQTELQRQSLATFVKLAFRHPEPSLRYWLIQALEASGEAFFRHTTWLALRVEAESGVRLDYLANRHDSTHPAREPDPAADSVLFEGEALDDEARRVALEMIDTVFASLERQFTLSLELAEADFFRISTRAAQVEAGRPL